MGRMKREKSDREGIRATEREEYERTQYMKKRGREKERENKKERESIYMYLCSCVGYVYVQ